MFFIFDATATRPSNPLRTNRRALREWIVCCRIITLIAINYSDVIIRYYAEAVLKKRTQFSLLNRHTQNPVRAISRKKNASIPRRIKIDSHVRRNEKTPPRLFYLYGPVI
jgi:hypothetical protein